jgi:hypothetical protein
MQRHGTGGMSIADTDFIIIIIFISLETFRILFG